MQVDISYMNISFGILNRNSMKNEMINFIILLAICYIYTSKYKQQKTISEGFKKNTQTKINLIIIIRNRVS